MMKSRDLILLVVVLVALALVFFLMKSSQERQRNQSDTASLLASEFDQDDLERIVIGFGDQAECVVLENLPDGWVVRTAHNHPASQQRVDGLLRSLTDLAGEFRSDVAEVLPDYGFSDSTTLTIAAYAAELSDPVVNLEIGKKPERSQGNFVKLPGSSAVYLTRQSILSSLGLYGGPALPESKHFLELEAQRLERDDIEAITWSDGENVVSMVKEFELPEPDPAIPDSLAMEPEIDRKVYEWKITAPQRKAALKTKGDGILGAVATIRAVDIVDPLADPATYGLADPVKTVTVRLQDGSTIDLAFGDSREAVDDQQAGTYLRIGDNSTVWVVSEYLLNNIFKTVDDLLPAEDE
ncbi:MAG: DUF4340 domain-containing protein [bacterium]